MTDKPAQDAPRVVDPDNVQEIFCEGPFHLNVAPVSTLTLTHVRPRPGALINEGRIELEAVVRSRLLLPLANLMMLRDLLNRLIKDEATPGNVTPGSASGVRLN